VLVRATHRLAGWRAGWLAGMAGLAGLAGLPGLAGMAVWLALAGWLAGERQAERGTS